MSVFYGRIKGRKHIIIRKIGERKWVKKMKVTAT